LLEGGLSIGDWLGCHWPFNQVRLSQLLQRTRWWACAHKLKTLFNLFFKFKGIILFHLTSQYFSSKAESLFRF